MMKWMASRYGYEFESIELMFNLKFINFVIEIAVTINI